MAVAVLLCAHCGSHEVDVCGWKTRTIAVLRCSSCHTEADVSGFTVGRVYTSDDSSMIAAAIEDAALPGMAVR